MKDFVISKQDKDKIYKMIFDKRLVLHGGVIGDYNDTQYIVTLLSDWVHYLDEYGIEYIEMERYRDNYEIKYRIK